MTAGFVTRYVAAAAQQDDDTDDPLSNREQVADSADDVLERVGDFLWGPPGRVLLVLLVALVAHLLVRRAIARFAKQVMDPDAVETLTRWRNRAPSMVRGSSVIAERAASRAHTLAHVLRSVATGVIWTIAFVMVLDEVGVALGPLIAGAGIVGVALGFGAQSLVKDFLTGFFMLVEDQCGVGDFVDVGDAIGMVEGVSLRTTRIRDLEGNLWHVPNGQIDRVANMSQEWSRSVLDLGVAYGTDLDLAKRVIKETADEMWRDPDWTQDFLEEPEVWGVQDLGADAITIRLVVKTEPGDQWAVTRELRQRMAQAFQRNSIEIPFPQRTVWHRQAEIRGSDGPPAPSS